MWQKLNNDYDLNRFMESMNYFHDSCIKELKYLSGAYVDEELSMYPINDNRILRIIVQRQFEKNSMIEMEFKYLKYLKLFPLDDKETCEIFKSTMIMKNNYIYWCDGGDFSEDDLLKYDGTIVCASEFRWRSIQGCMGSKEFYYSKK